jgi:DNA-binding Lrp family transcriptional regulator
MKTSYQPINSRGGFVKTEQGALNDTEALQLRSQGLTYREIAARLGINESTAHRRVQRALEAIPFEEVNDYRALEQIRLDALQLAIWDKAMSGDLRAIDRVLAIAQRRAKLLGLDAPTRSHASVADLTTEDINAEVRRLERLLRETPTLTFDDH